MRVLVIVLVSCLLTFCLFAESPDELTGEYYGHLKDERWENLGEYYSDEALEEFRGLFGIILEIPDESDQEELIEMLFGEKATAEEIKNMSDEEFFNAVMQAIYALIGKVALMDYDSIKVIGCVEETESLVHVVSRCQFNIGINDGDAMEMAPVSMEIMEVLSFEKTKDEWKMLLDPKIRALAEQIKYSLGM
jgi:hypothetical protein